MQKKRILSLFLTFVFALALLYTLSAAAEVNQIPANWLLAKLDEKAYTKVAEISGLEGYSLLEGITPNSTGIEPELYYAPDDAENPVRFLYYTTGYGAPRTLANIAVRSYQNFYDQFTASEIIETTIGEKDCLTFSYTAEYPDVNETSTVYEQSAVCYFPANEDCFVACIISLAFDSSDEFLSAEELSEYTALAGNALQMAQ